EESPIVFLRLRKAARTGTTKVFHLGQWTTSAIDKSFGTLLSCMPGNEPAAIEGLFFNSDTAPAFTALSGTGSVVLVGERAAEVPGLLSSVLRLVGRTGAKVAWIPRRAGERGALEAGAVPTLLPGGRLVTDDVARAEVERAWGLDVGTLPARPGRDTDGIL